MPDPARAKKADPERRCLRRLRRLAASLLEARREACWERMQRVHLEEGLKFVLQLEHRLASSGLRAGDWYVGRDAVGRARQSLKDLRLMRRHRDRLLEDSLPADAGGGETDV